MDKVECNVDGKVIEIETGRIAKQSNGAAIVSCGQAAVLVTANRTKPRDGIDFFPLTVDYLERIYASGKIPGGFFKRERGLTEKEVLTSRFIDRCLRPLFPDGYRDETQVTATVLSAEPGYDTDMLAFIGASAAVQLSDIPFPEPIAGVRVSRVDGQFVANGSFEENEDSDINVIIAGTRDSIVMVEGGGREASEADMLKALRFGHEQMQPLLDAQVELVRKAGKAKLEVAAKKPDPGLVAQIDALARERIEAASRTPEKHARYRALNQVDSEVLPRFLSEYKSQPRTLASLADVEEAQRGARELQAEVKQILHDLRADVMREAILVGESRLDGRSTTDVRPIQCQVQAFPRLPRLGALHARRDPGRRDRHARWQARRADDRGLAGHLLPQLLSALQLPGLQRGRGSAAACAEPTRAGVTGRWRSAPFGRCCPTWRNRPSRFVSSPRSWRATAPRPWRRCAGARWR